MFMRQKDSWIFLNYERLSLMSEIQDAFRRCPRQKFEVSARWPQDPTYGKRYTLTFRQYWLYKQLQPDIKKMWCNNTFPIVKVIERPFRVTIEAAMEYDQLPASVRMRPLYNKFNR